MEKIALKIKRWLDSNRPEFFCLIIIIFAASFSRLWRIPEYLTFLGDEGRDALAVRAMIIEHKFRLIGPVTSVGNMYLGPLYYYLMLPAMVISRLSPVGPAVMVAFFGIATTILIWLVGREWFGRSAGIIAALLYAVSPVAIEYSRTSWNPNIMPFFALLSIWGIWRVWYGRQFWWLSVIYIAISFAVQSHYLGLLLFPTVVFFQGLTFARLWKNKYPIKKFFLFFVIGLIIFSFLTILPLVWFDLRHDFINFKAMKDFFTIRQTTVNLKFYKAIPNFWPLWQEISIRLLTAKQVNEGKWFSLVMVILILFSFFRLFRLKSAKRERESLILLAIWLLTGLFGLGSYKQHIYDHYFGFLFPAVFILTGFVIKNLWENFRAGRLLAMAIVFWLTYLSFANSPLRYPPNNQLGRTQAVAHFLMDKAGNQPYNLALIAERNYEAAYEYYLTIFGKPPIHIDPQRAEETITNQLFVICEQLPCSPVNHPKAEIAMFGWVKIDQKWEVAGVEIYRLVHNYPSK